MGDVNRNFSFCAEIQETTKHHQAILLIKSELISFVT